eukprot:m.18545 g.18545  ORF g.18545 m.18545 type:complete len:50 (+) comp8510_c0_seq1:326-475(+)
MVLLIQDQECAWKEKGSEGGERDAEVDRRVEDGRSNDQDFWGLFGRKWR